MEIQQTNTGKCSQYSANKRGEKDDLVYSIKMEIVRRGRELREKDFHKQHEADRPVFNSRILFKSDSKIITFLYENEKK